MIALAGVPGGLFLFLLDDSFGVLRNVVSLIDEKHVSFDKFVEYNTSNLRVILLFLVIYVIIQMPSFANCFTV